MRLLCVERWSGGGFVRVLRHGPGFWWTSEPPMFKERMGVDRPFVRVGQRRFFWLPASRV